MLLDGFEGVYPAAVSPRDQQGAFSVAAFEKLIDRVYEANVNGLYVCGNTGEGYVMTVADRKLATEVAVRMSKGRGKVVVHVGAPAERDAVELARHASESGADGISSLPPYVQRYAFRDILAFYTAVAGAAEIPLFVYYIPVVTNREFSPDEVGQLLAIDGVAGLKFTSHNLFLLEEIVNRPERPQVFNGSDEIFLAGVAMGAQAGIGSFYNIMPGHFVGIHQAVQGNDLATGRKLQRDVNQVIRICQTYGGLPSLRAILEWQGVDCGDPIPPTRPLSEDEKLALRRQLGASGVGILG